MHIADFKGCEVEVLAEDATRVGSDALIASIHSSGEWIGGINAAIRNCAGQHFHAQARDRSDLQDGMTFIAKRNGVRGGMFKDVLFVCDDWKRPLQGIVREALWRANDSRLSTVTLPAIRTGAAAGKFERTPAKALAALVNGVKQFMASQPSITMRRISIVLGPGSTLCEQVAQAFKI